MREPLLVIACNYAETTIPVSKGSLAYVLGNNSGQGWDRILLLARSRSGRWIEKWERADILVNFRMKTIPEEKSIHARLINSPGERELGFIREALGR